MVRLSLISKCWCNGCCILMSIIDGQGFMLVVLDPSGDQGGFTSIIQSQYEESKLAILAMMLSNDGCQSHILSNAIQVSLDGDRGEKKCQFISFLQLHSLPLTCLLQPVMLHSGWQLPNHLQIHSSPSFTNYLDGLPILPQPQMNH